MNRRNLWIGAAAAALSLALTACGGSAAPAPAPGAAPTPTPAKLSGKVTAGGSTALLPLVKAAGDEFQDKNPDVTINSSGGGSFTGMKLVAEGSVNIGMSDVDLPSDLQGKDALVDTKVCIAPFLIITNKDVTVDNLTQDQLISIFTGKTTNWKDVGGKDEPIAIIHRAASSGSRATIKALVLKGQEFTDKATIQDANGSVRTAIAAAPGSIGYVDAAYLDSSVKALKYNGVEYTADNVKSGKYPVFAYEHIYTKGQPTGVVKAFVDYVMSADFQNRNVPKLGFVPLSK